jgi:hypothetical protein
MAKGHGRVARRVRRLGSAPIDELAGLFGSWLAVDERLAAPQRDRLFSPARTFWLFLSQVLAADGSCREVVRKFLAWRALEGLPPASPKTGAYCKARARLPLDDLAGLHRAAGGRVQGLGAQKDRWRGRVVKVADGSSVSMPDTPENQARYPQSRKQKPGCGFPVMTLVAVFSLATGTLLDVAKGTLRVAEQTLLRQLWGLLESGDVLLADRKFCSYADFYFLRLRAVDCVMRNHQRRKTGIEEIKRLSKGDRLIRWLKMKPCPKWLTPQQWQAVPDRLRVREITFCVEIPGFRAETITIATTLLDPKKFPKDAFAELYRMRWMAELFLRDIKSALGMDILRCQTPDMVEKELYMHLIAHNLIRALLLQAAHAHCLSPFRLSFKGTAATVRQWAPIMAAAPNDVRARMYAALLETIARDPVPCRPNRTEPRARKRRPKNYQLLTAPRATFKEIFHRNHYAKA